MQPSLSSVVLSAGRLLGTDLVTTLWFLGAAGVLDFFDMSLPRGDSAGGSGALCASALIVVGPVRAIGIAIMSVILTHGTRRGSGARMRLASAVISRVVALGAGTYAMSVLPPGTSPTISFILVPAIFLVVELIASQAASAVMTRRSFLRLAWGNASSQAALIAAQWSASVLLLLTYGGMRVWSLVPVVVLLLLIRQSYALFLSIRETYRTTVEVLVEAAESQDPRRIGHSDRTSLLARTIAMGCGLSASEVERIAYAALLHDLGKLAEQSAGEERSAVRRPSSADVVQGVEFFTRIAPVLRVCDGMGQGDDDSDLLAGFIVALSSDIDAAYHPGVAAAHGLSAVGILSQRIPPTVKARAVAAALRLGYRIPAVG